MSIIILLILNFFFFQIGKKIFEYWFNPITIYVFVWTGLISLYELKLLKYYDLSIEAWFVIFLAFCSFVFGIFIFYYASRDKEVSFRTSKIGIKELFENPRLIKFLILSTGLISLLSSLQNWYILLQEYDTLTNILLSAAEIYKKRVDGEIKGVIPYTWAFGFVSIFFSAIWSAKTNRFSLLTIFPIIAIILKDLAMIARSNILFAFLEFITVFFLVRLYFNKNHILVRKFDRKNLLIGGFLLIFLVIGSATLVRSVKGTVESFKASTNTLSKIRGGIVITPSLYLYLSAHVGVLNKYLLVNEEQDETMFGQNSFESVYNILSKFNLTKDPTSYQRGYYIPMWTNTGTYIREIHADFGILGVTIVPFLLGLSSIYLWKKFLLLGDLFSLNLLIHIILIIWFSFLVMITRQGAWFISIIVTSVLLSFISGYFKKKES
ncbi:MAG: oligosaccharide repeat unit polymerase [Melioribacteraceae bacterium]|nr:oligosaccharide repeat unit polymerase [Melioribacteraceae bacterium]